MTENKVRPELAGVPETLLWPLHCRAEEAQRRDALLHDPWAIDLRDRIDYPFRETFGEPHPALALRALAFDSQIAAFLDAHPNATVVALGDGLETQCHRVDNGQVTWLSVDLPETIALREQILPPGDRARTLACSALDRAWLDAVDATRPVFISAAGLFMYLTGDEVYGLIEDCAARFPGGTIMFDVIPRWLTNRDKKGSRLDRLLMRDKGSAEGTYTLPEMTWGSNLGEATARLRSTPGIARITDVPMPPGRGFVFKHLNPKLGKLPAPRNLRPANIRVDFD